MSNRLNMARVQDILTLWQQGTSQRRIARLLGIDRETVSRHLRLAPSVSNPARAPAGTEGEPPPNATRAPAGNSGQQSQCEPFRSIIEDKVRRQLTAQRIYQDLKFEHGFTGSYYSVRRFVRKLENVRELPFRRMECEPGAEVQVDFGKGAQVRRANGKKKRPHVFRMVLSFSRKAYSEAVWHQDTETFLRCLENAFWFFGGVPRTVVVDNLKAAVIHPDWYDPELNPKLQAFGRHYGTVILPTKPYMPRHKGKTERQVGYVQDNGLKDREFDDLAAQNTYLSWWEQAVADLRIHGTTKRQVKMLFDGQERSTLLPLPAGHFPCFQEAQRSVHRDGHVEVDKAYYSVPPEYTGQIVWVRYDGRLVRIFNQRMDSIAVHCRAEAGKFSTQSAHIPSAKIAGVERGMDYHLRRAARIGPWSHLWAKAMLEERGIPGIRVLVGFLTLASRYSDRELEHGCQIALRQGCYHLRSLRQLLKQPTPLPDLAFMDRHPLIRDLKEYQDLIWIDFDPEERKMIFPSPDPDPEEADMDERGSFAFKGDENHEREDDDDAQAIEVVGTGIEPGGPVAGGGGESPVA